MGKAVIFIDDGYLNKSVIRSGLRIRIDFPRFSEYIAEGSPVLRTYYYTGRPVRDQNGYDSRYRFLEALENMPRYEVRYGRLAPELDRAGEPRKNEYGQTIYRQKGVDVLLACDLVRLSIGRRIDEAILVTGDSDFLPAVSIAKDEGVEIKLVYSSSQGAHRELIRMADTTKLLTEKDLLQVRLERHGDVSPRPRDPYDTYSTYSTYNTYPVPWPEKKRSPVPEGSAGTPGAGRDRSPEDAPDIGSGPPPKDAPDIGSDPSPEDAPDIGSGPPPEDAPDLGSDPSPEDAPQAGSDGSTEDTSENGAGERNTWKPGGRRYRLFDEWSRKILGKKPDGSEMNGPQVPGSSGSDLMKSRF